MLGYNANKNTAGGGGATNNVGWQTGDGGDADLTGGDYTGYDDEGSDQANGGAYGYGGATVTNWGGNGNWQAAIACVNQAGISAGSSSIAPVRFRDKTMDTVNKAKGRGFLVREFALKKNVTRTSTRSCPAGMVRRGNLSYTVQEFPADHKSPKWKDRALVDVKMTPKGNNAGSVKMTLKRAKSPTVVQFQLRCGKR
ncbi:MAG: hypothetical protein JHD03_06305 [Solirubrobacteraceae bacterium]|nr:hypothetical protein [Solirubrobacteraceae bacterium]